MTDSFLKCFPSSTLSQQLRIATIHRHTFSKSIVEILKVVFLLVTLLRPNLPGFDPLQFVQFSFIGGFKNFDHTSLLHDIIITFMSETSQHFHQKYAKIAQKSPQDLPLLRKQRRSQFVLYCWCLSTLE